MNQPIQSAPQSQMPQTKPSMAGYIVWVIITLPALYFISTTLLCEKFGFLRSSDPMSCGSDSAGIPTMMGLAVLGIWTFLSFIIFLVAKNRTPAYIFGGLLAIEILWVLLVITGILPQIKS